MFSQNTLRNTKHSLYTFRISYKFCVLLTPRTNELQNLFTFHTSANTGAKCESEKGARDKKKPPTNYSRTTMKKNEWRNCYETGIVCREWLVMICEHFVKNFFMKCICRSKWSFDKLKELFCHIFSCYTFANDVNRADILTLGCFGICILLEEFPELRSFV